ncbi:MAG: hypothetical protein GTO51_09860 [Candidatus Latescibacteria bacterium]|nr:hypothetical protein [Candidatus Latescibacterota bacterium]NIM66273.1 hypothetical protein [Candidatus Latescibacterota bacterium]NIO02754.1 hypothetical protein [Candidatus Latescibacterota bacterium]NIO29889.1 hypothetical protein [Candidatus Latescibacterota bacterium]NIO57503.1 hypothetical protein [Candidatus Latescibacterota bacterium]
MIRAQILGIIVIFYCAFHWLPIAPLLRFAAISPDPWEAFDAILSLILLAGGIAALCDKAWGKKYVRFGSAALILAGLVNIVISRLNDSAYALLKAELIGILPLLIILLASFVTKSSAEIREELSRKAKTKRNLRDLAYGSYLWVGVSMIIFCLARLLSNDPHWKDLAVLIVALPILWSAPVIALVGIISSILVFRDWRLDVLALLTISSIVLSFGAAHELVSDAQFLTFIALVSVLILIFSARWFVIGRRRLR